MSLRSDLQDEHTLLTRIYQSARWITNFLDTFQSNTNSRFNRLEANQAAQQKILQRILEEVIPQPTSRVVVSIFFNGEHLEGDSKMVIKDNEQFDITLAPVDAKGRPSQIDPAKTVFETTNASVTLTPGADGLSCNVSGSDVGSTQISGSVTDLNNPDDTVPFSPVDVQVLPGDTAMVQANVGPVRPQ